VIVLKPLCVAVLVDFADSGRQPALAPQYVHVEQLNRIQSDDWHDRLLLFSERFE